jgi:hypothetical protein
LSAPTAATRLPTPTRLPRLALAADEWAVLRWLLPLALLHGLLYLALVPPWEHYDEPGHFLYAAEIAAGELHGRGPAAIALSRETADSMVRYGFLDGTFRPNFLAPGAIRVAEDQRVHPPLYYALVAAPLSVVRFLSIETQLYVARGVSLLLYALTIVAAWRIARVALPDEPTMQLALPLMLLFTPTFADLMTAVNNDVLVNFALAVALLGAVLLVRDGTTPAAFALLLLGFGVALASKRTALAFLPVVALAVAWSLWRTPLGWRKLLVGAALLAGLAVASLYVTRVDDGDGGHWTLAARPWLDQLDRLYLRLSLDSWLRSVGDVERAQQLYLATAWVGFTSFWARLSWGNVALPSLWDWLFVGLVCAALVGLLLGALRGGGALPLWQRRCIWLFVFAVGSGCLAMLARLHPLPGPEVTVYIPRGRYMFWAMVPAIWLLALGLQRLTPARWRARTPWLLVGFFVAADIAAIGALLYAFHRA